jgi:hypothetical protein
MSTTRVLSIEDSKLNQSTLVGSRKKEYKDLDLSFTVKPSGELYKKVDAAAVRQAVKTLISTNRFEKPFQPDFGADIRSLLFELIDDPSVGYEIEERIKQNIERYEPRANVMNVEVNERPDNNSISVTIDFQVINTEEIVSLTTNFSRLR